MRVRLQGHIYRGRQVRSRDEQPLVIFKRALETAGVEFIEENGGGPGVRLRKKPQRERLPK